MTDPLRMFILAGEASGDIIGADLVRKLRKRVPLEITGVGGSELQDEGLASLFPMENLSVMGWSDVIKRLPLLLWRVRQTAASIIRQRPDVAVLVDSQVFSKAVAKFIRRVAPEIPLVLYVSPTVWAWRPERAADLKPLFDEVLAVLPFEPEVMADLGGPPTTFVGHPALEGFATRDEQPAKGPLLLLPGSRLGEVRRHLNLMRDTATALKGHPRITGFVIPTLPGLVERLGKETANWPVPVEIVTGDQRREAFATAYAAFAVSGTITFELALSGIPMVVTYVADPHQAKHAKQLPHPIVMALPNLVLGRMAVPELQFVDPLIPRSIKPLTDLLNSPQEVAAQLSAFREMRSRMQEGAPEAPRQDPAERVLAIANQRLLIGS